MPHYLLRASYTADGAKGLLAEGDPPGLLRPRH